MNIYDCPDRLSHVLSESLFTDLLRRLQLMSGWNWLEYVGVGWNWLDPRNWKLRASDLVSPADKNVFRFSGRFCRTGVKFVIIPCNRKLHGSPVQIPNWGKAAVVLWYGCWWPTWQPVPIKPNPIVLPSANAQQTKKITLMAPKSQTSKWPSMEQALPTFLSYCTSF